MEKRKIVVIVVATSLVMSSFVVWFWFREKDLNGWQRHDVILSKEAVPEVLPEIKVLSGTVETVSGSTIVFEVFPLDVKKDDIRVMDAAGVPIFKLITFSQEEMQKKIEEQPTQPTSDSINLSEKWGVLENHFFKKVPATLADMKPGDVVTVVSDIDIRNVKEIKPKEISFVFGSQVAYPEGYQP